VNAGRAEAGHRGADVFTDTVGAIGGTDQMALVLDAFSGVEAQNREPAHLRIGHDIQFRR
jgi:hypothetical protein